MHNRIRQIRSDAGMTRKAFAEKLRLSDTYIYLIENGQREPSERTIKDLCDVFRISEEWLRTGIGTMHPPETLDEELAKFFAEVLSTEPGSIQRRLAAAFSKLTWQQMQSLADIAEILSNTKGN